jgi:acyl transferase domain-containing protein
VFTGQGAQYFAMGRELLKDNSLFYNSMKECEAIIKYVNTEKSKKINLSNRKVRLL